MRRIWFHFTIALILAHALALAQQSTSNSTDTLKFENGTIANGSYSNECLGFTLPIPAGWEIDNQGFGADGKARHTPGGLALLVLHPHTLHRWEVS